MLSVPNEVRRHQSQSTKSPSLLLSFLCFFNLLVNMYTPSLPVVSAKYALQVSVPCQDPLDNGCGSLFHENEDTVVVGSVRTEQDQPSRTFLEHENRQLKEIRRLA